MIDLDDMRDVGRVGRKELEERVRILCGEVAQVRAHEAQLTEQLTRVQARCTELLEENRSLRAEHGASPSEPVVPAGIVLPGWLCAACGGFNGEAKERLAVCRACGAARPT